MNAKDKSINQIITALIELEAKECHSVFFEYGNSLFKVKISCADKILYERTINSKQEQTEINKLSKLIETLIGHIWKTVFQCYKRDFIIGEKSGKWEKVKPTFVYGKNAMYSMLYGSSGYFIDDPDNNLQYFVDYKEVSEIKQQY